MKNYCYALLLGLIFGCKTPYQPVLNSKVTNYLVVDGVINNSSTDTTFIKLSRTVTLTSAVATRPELKAQVSVEDGQGFTAALQETPKGVYIATSLALNNTKKYRLRIKTADNKTYLSDLMSVLYAPPIDSIGFYNKDTGIQIYVNTHDPNNNTRYYRWDFTEVWKFRTAYSSYYVSDGTKIIPRTPETMLPTHCWGNDVSHNVTIGSSIKLTQDVIYNAPLTYIDGTSEKISIRYSILVKQYAISKEAYTFWDQLKKNTESLGSIFDAQPSESKSNIHCVENIAEPVLGYVSVSNVQSKRVYFNKADLHIFTVPDAITKCSMDSQYYVHPTNRSEMVQTNLIPVTESIPLLPFKDYGGGYLSANKSCVDCTTRGSKTQPSFWKDQ